MKMAKKKSDRSDEAHKQTDIALADLEKRIAEIYKEARDSLDATIRDYFAKLEERDAEMKKLIGTVLNGKIWTEQDYKLWRLNQIARGKRFEALRDKIAKRYTDANETASAYVNDATPGIYSLNRNYAAYTVDKATGGALTVRPDGETLNADFILFDEQTVKRLIVEQPDVMPYYPPERAVRRGIDLEYGKTQITKQVTSGALQGLGVGKIADALQERMETMSRTSALRAARTGVTAAQNAGRMDAFHAAQEMGIQNKKQWLSTLDGRTRHEHQILDGQVQEIDAPFEVNGLKIRYPGDPEAAPRLVYNCRCTLVTDLPQNLSLGQRRARDPVTGESVVIDYTTYEDWMESLKAQHGEKTVDNALKKVHNESADREQHEKYRKRLGKIVPKNFKDFQNLKYENPDEWELIKKSYRNNSRDTTSKEIVKKNNESADRKLWEKYKSEFGDNVPETFSKFQSLKYNSGNWDEYQDYIKALKSGELSALADFSLYQDTSREIDEKLVGLITADGIQITGKSKHFISRIIGSVEQRRSGVSIENAKKAILSPTEIKKRPNGSHQYILEYTCDVSVNPDTGNLIQTNPRHSKKVEP